VGKAYHNSEAVGVESWKEISPQSEPVGHRDRKYSEWSYYAGLDEIYHAGWAAAASARLRVFRDALDHLWPGPGGYPVKLIQVAGTSGKGSTCKFLQSGLSRFGKAGCYVKPHVFDYAERFTAEAGQVGHGEIMEAWNEVVKPYCVESALKGEGWLLNHQETSLLIALRIFEKHRLDWAAVETGIGGRYDPASALEVAATVLTNVGEDHEEVLGSEHWQRALEKAGICRPGVPLVLGDDDKRTVEVVTAACKDAGTPLMRVTKAEIRGLEGILKSLGRRGSHDFVVGSRHQLLNAAVAMKVITALVDGATAKQVAPNLLETSYVGRFWKLEEGVYADVAHNPSKTEALAKELESRFPRKRKVFVVGISGERDPVKVVGPLVPQAKAIVVTSAGFKGQDAGKVYLSLRKRFPALPIHLEADPRATAKVARHLRGPGEVVVFTGSTYMIDQALNPDERLRHLNTMQGWREVNRRPPEESLVGGPPETAKR
jgi:dihydrofolate synthase / folylpolyglutamate synthase